METLDNIIKEIVMKQFDIIGETDVKFEDLKGEWYTDYTATTKQDKEWEEFCIKLMMKELRYTKKYARKQFQFINLSYGLKIKDNV